MKKIKCSIYECDEVMDVENNEVRAINIINHGHRFVCIEHYNYIKENKVKPVASLIYGVREKKHENKNFFHKRQWINKSSQDKKD